MESQLYLAGANPEALMDNKFTRAQFIPNDWIGVTEIPLILFIWEEA